MKTLLILISAVFLSGCATNFSNPIVKKNFSNTPYIQVTMQGSMPSSSVYRSGFYTTNDALGRAFFTPEIVAQIVSEALTAIGNITTDTTTKYYDTLKNNYRWRTDVFIYGYTNLNENQIYNILKHSTKPQVDAQRPPTIK